MVCASCFGDTGGAGETLKSRGVEPNVDGLRSYLQMLVPGNEQRKTIEALIKQLGHDEFRKREEAMAKLKTIPLVPRDALERAAKSDDEEMKWRAEEVLEQLGDTSDAVFNAAMDIIAKQKMPGLTRDILNALAHIERQDQQRAAEGALQATAADTDVPTFTAMLKHKSPVIRRAAVSAIIALTTGQNVKDLKPLMDDPDEQFRLTVARALANRGDRDCLETLVQLLESKHFSIRFQAVRILRALTGQNFKFNDSDEAARKKATDAWAKWIKANGAIAELHLPLALDDEIDLFESGDLTDWVSINGGRIEKNTKDWQFKKGVLMCAGQGHGFLRTRKAFRDYVLKLEWRWPQAGGDSGVWLQMADGNLSRPKCIEAQLLSGKSGDFWMIGNYAATVKGRRTSSHVPKTGPNNEKPIGQWNQMEIKILNGELTVKVNGALQNAAKDCPTEPGYIGLQVEGSPIHFRKVRITPLSD